MLIALHAPDGFLAAPVAVATAVAAAAAISLALRATSAELGDRQVPLAGVAAAFVFAAQMVNFPVAAGTTGHLLGGALAAILLGPHLGALVVTVVVVVQALLFADGGLTALGYNSLNMAIVPAYGGWALFRALRRLLPANGSGVVGAAGLAAGGSVALGAMAFSLEWLFGATAPVPFDTVFASVVGVHLLIGVGEGLITATTVAAVLTARPDLVTGAADLAPAHLADRPRVGVRTFLLASVGVAVGIAAVVSQFAADDPDGLERAAADEGFADSATEHDLADIVFADYATRGIDDERVSFAVAGASGVAVSLAVAAGVVGGSRRRSLAVADDTGPAAAVETGVE